MISLAVEGSKGGKNIFDFLLDMYPDAEKRTLSSNIKKGNVMLNGKDARINDKVRSGDNIRLFVTAETLGFIQKPEIIYQDENIVVADKPAGLLSVSDNGEPSAVKMVEEAMKQRGEYSLEALILPYLVYPLDKYASGLIILAKHEDAYLFLAQALSQRRIARYFVCPVVGQTKEKDELLAYHLLNKANMSVRILSDYRKNAKPIVTRYNALCSVENMTLLNIRPITNYYNQIRAHLAFTGHPVVGDDIFGDKRFNRKHRAQHISLWLKTVVFEVGTSHSFSYLNGKRFESKSCCFSKCVYDAGLVQTDIT